MRALQLIIVTSIVISRVNSINASIPLTKSENVNQKHSKDSLVILEQYSK